MDALETDFSLPHLIELNCEVQLMVCEFLSAQDLCVLTTTCRHFRDQLCQGVQAELLWRGKCTELLGKAFVAVHALSAASEPCMATFWRRVYQDALSMEVVRWWEEGSSMLKQSVEEDLERAMERLASGEGAGTSSESGGFPLPVTDLLRSQCQRSGHVSTCCGELCVVTGGVLHNPQQLTDVLVVQLQTLAVTRPEVHGHAPLSRCRHTVVRVEPQPGGALATGVALQVGADALETGHVLLLFGGYNPAGQEFGGLELKALWVRNDGRAVHWVHLTAQGIVPEHVFHHTADVVGGGKHMVVYGGEGYWLQDRYAASPFVYALCLESLVWRKVATNVAEQHDSPGLRSLHASTVRVSPGGHEELVVVGGYCGNRLADMRPFALDVETWTWRRGPLPAQGAAPLPVPRQRCATMTVGPYWLLLHGGCPSSGCHLDTLHKLHLPSLQWREPLQMMGEPWRGTKRIAGHTLAGGIAFGGNMPTLMGIMPIAKLDVLLIGRGPQSARHETAPESPLPGSLQMPSLPAAADASPGPHSSRSPRTSALSSSLQTTLWHPHWPNVQPDNNMPEEAPFAQPRWAALSRPHASTRGCVRAPRTARTQPPSLVLLCRWSSGRPRLAHPPPRSAHPPPRSWMCNRSLDPESAVQVEEAVFAIGGGLRVQLWRDVNTGLLHAYNPATVPQPHAGWQAMAALPQPHDMHQMQVPPPPGGGGAQPQPLPGAPPVQGAPNAD